MNGISIEILLGRLVGLVIGFTLHEWGHAWTAYRLGDNTPYYQGRLTLNPRAHLEPIGIVLALIAGFGWAKPTPINPNAFYPNEKRGLLIVTLAGPMMNLIVALAFGIVIRLLTAGGLFDNRLAEYGIGSSRALTFLYQVLGTVVLFNLVLFLFNLIPLAPLDGYTIAVSTLPPEQSRVLVKYERETTLALMLLILLGAMTQGRFNLLWQILGPPLRALYELFTHFHPVF